MLQCVVMKLPWVEPEGTYRDSRWRDKREFESGAIVCEETGALPVNGVCPVHRGDACLYSSALLITWWRENVA